MQSARTHVYTFVFRVYMGEPMGYMGEMGGYIELDVRLRDS